MVRKMYAVALDNPEPAIEDCLKQRYESVFKHADSFYLVVGDANDASEDTAVAAGSW